MSRDAASETDFRCRVHPHGRYQIELKTRYPVPQEPRVSYNLELYLYCPSQLQLDAMGYGSERFMEDFHSLTRHTAPHLPLRRLLDQNDPDSPFSRIRGTLESTRPTTSVIRYELRVLANAYRALARGRRRAVEAAIGDKQDDSRRSALRRFIRSLKRFRRELDRLVLDVRSSVVAEDLDPAVRWADEWVSLITENECISLYTRLSQADMEEKWEKLLQRIIRAEVRRRKQAGYESVSKAGDLAANERRQYHENMLKKWVQGALYMSSEPSRTPRNITQAIAAIAAAAAMSFAVVATLLADRLFASYSVPWALLVVVSYIFKDRIKESLRGALSGFFPRLFFDRGGRLLDPAVNRSVGLSREAVQFCEAQDVPESVRRVRKAETNPFRAFLPPEDVIRYSKQIKLRAKLLQRSHSRLESITEITRINIDRWLRQMDDPTSRKVVLSDGHPRVIDVPRYYHLHLVLALSTRKGRANPYFFHYRVLLGRNGLNRIEDLDP
jgi:hypothetical protein